MATVTVPVPLTNGAATLSLGDDERMTSRNGGRPSAAIPLAIARHRIAIWTALCRVLDSVSALAVLILIFVVTNLASMPRGLAAFLAVRVTLRSLLLLTAFAIVWRLTFAFFGLYDAAQLRSWREEAKRVVAACSLGTLSALIFPLSSTSGRFDL